MKKHLSLWPIYISLLVNRVNKDTDSRSGVVVVVGGALNNMEKVYWRAEKANGLNKILVAFELPK